MSRCGFCPVCLNAELNKFKGIPNATKVLAHVIKKPSRDIRSCRGNIPPVKMQQEIAGLNLGVQEVYSSGGPNSGSATYSQVPRFEVL
jgi:hypothetical protein